MRSDNERERETVNLETDYLRDMAVWLCVGDRTEFDEKWTGDGGLDLIPVRREYRSLLIGRYSNQRFSIRQNGRGKVLAWAGGGGYDRQGTALADAVRILYALPRFDGGAGESAVIEHARQHGVAVYRLSDALYSLPTGSREMVN